MIRTSALLSTLVILGAVLGPSVSDATQLNLTWMDTSGGQAGSRIERKIGATGTYTEIARGAPGVTAYVDATVATGTTYCYRVRAFDASGTSDYSNESCRSLSSEFALTVTKAGTGAGTVASSPAGITCGTDCHATYASSTVVTLTSTPAPGATFTGWSGGGCAGTAPCTLAGNAALTVRATFVTKAPPVAPPSPGPGASFLVVIHSGTGTVISSGGAMSCRQVVCWASYPSSTVVTLEARPGPDMRFAGWNGRDCGATNTCTVTVDQATVVIAFFEPKPRPR